MTLAVTKRTGIKRLMTSKEKSKEYITEVARARSPGANQIAERRVGILLRKTNEIAKMY